MADEQPKDQPKPPRRPKTRRVRPGVPLCEVCGVSMAKNGIDKGKQAYRCTICGKTDRDNKSPKGRPMLGAEKLSGAERHRRWREKQKQKREQEES